MSCDDEKWCGDGLVRKTKIGDDEADSSAGEGHRHAVQVHKAASRVIRPRVQHPVAESAPEQESGGERLGLSCLRSTDGLHDRAIPVAHIVKRGRTKEGGVPNAATSHCERQHQHKALVLAQQQDKQLTSPCQETPSEESCRAAAARPCPLGPRCHKR